MKEAEILYVITHEAHERLWNYYLKVNPIHMKKLLVLVGLTIAFSSPGLAHAEELTKADVKILSPQLVSLFASLNTTVPSVIQTKVTAQNNLFKHYSSVLGNLSLRLSSTPPPSNTELENMARTVAVIRSQASATTSWRVNVDAAVTNMTRILGNIRVILSSAV